MEGERWRREEGMRDWELKKTLEAAGQAAEAACLLEVKHTELAEAAVEGKECELVPWRSCRQCRICSRHCKYKSLMQRFGGGQGREGK